MTMTATQPRVSNRLARTVAQEATGWGTAVWPEELSDDDFVEGFHIATTQSAKHTDELTEEEIAAADSALRELCDSRRLDRVADRREAEAFMKVVVKRIHAELEPLWGRDLKVRLRQVKAGIESASTAYGEVVSKSHAVRTALVRYEKKVREYESRWDGHNLESIIRQEVSTHVLPVLGISVRPKSRRRNRVNTRRGAQVQNVRRSESVKQGATGTKRSRRPRRGQKGEIRTATKSGIAPQANANQAQAAKPNTTNGTKSSRSSARRGRWNRRPRGAAATAATPKV